MNEQDFYEAQNENEALDEALTEVKGLIENLEETGLKDWVDELEVLKKDIENVMEQNERIMDTYWEENTRTLNVMWEESR